MDDPGWQWPAWKFGMKRDDLFTKLHDQYNTIPSSIQDPEAFHHDVYEISGTASTADEFHQLLADRKQQRIRELNDSLESASLEIISNPLLIGTEQWQYAVQLFRTKSLDSLVRYFASYLPEAHPWHSNEAANAYGDEPICTFTDTEDDCPVTHEPFPISTSVKESHLPPSPRSLTACSDESSAVSSFDDYDHHSYTLDNMTPARSLSFSEPDTDMMAFSGSLSTGLGEAGCDNEPPTPSTSVSDLSETRSLPEDDVKQEAYSDLYPSSVAADDNDDDVETPTPHNSASSDSYMTRQHELNSSTSRERASPLYAHVLQEYVRSSQNKSRRDGSPSRSVRRRSPELGRVHKPLSEPTRQRPTVKRRSHD